jgi:hypothetical protein
LSRARLVTAALGLWGTLLTAQTGPYDIPLSPTASAPAAQGHARLHFAASPFGIAVTADGRARYDVAITLSHLPRVDSTGDSSGAYVAWAVSPDLGDWRRLGTVESGTTTVGPVDLNKFLIVISIERQRDGTRATGPIVLRGYSPSIWLQSFITHPLFRGVN